jgi:asparagine synthase (glutamine-hydrolysing)
MCRYIILIWNIGNPSDCEAADCIGYRIRRSSAGWRCVLDRPGMYVGCLEQEFPPATAILVDNCRGVILGSVFRSPGLSPASHPTPIRVLSPGQSEEILRSKGRSLIADCWGYYVAALHFPDDASAVVLRSPVSPLACFHVERGTFNVFFSKLDDYIGLKVAPLSINWDSITAQVVGGDHLTNETAIKEIDSLECGESVECKPNGSIRRAYWDPRSLLEERSAANFGEAARSLRRATQYCISAHSSRHSSILVKLSGGLDSSIVLASLGRAPHQPSITAVNYHSRGSGDERRFARTMAAAVNCQLIARTRNQQLDFRCFLDCNRTVSPVLNFSAPDVETRNISLARELGATAIFDGELGDNIFGSHPGPGALVECFRQNGLGRGFLGVAVDYAMLTRQSLWRALALARREALSVSENPDFSSSREMQRVFAADSSRWAILASAEAEEHHQNMADRFLHPWFKQSRRIAPGSYALLFGLLTVTSTTYHSPFSGSHDPPRVSPLVSQPLLELALRMPAYLHCKSAQDRAVARTAFADMLPPEILQRGLGKGGPGLWARDVVENNTGFLREFLLDGILVRRHLIDRRKLESVLSPRIAKSTIIAGDIFAKLYIEAWLRAWQPVIGLSPSEGDSIDRIGRAWTAMGLPHPSTKT